MPDPIRPGLRQAGHVLKFCRKGPDDLDRRGLLLSLCIFLGDRGYRGKGGSNVYLTKYRFIAPLPCLILPPFLDKTEYPVGLPGQEPSRLESMQAPEGTTAPKGTPFSQHTQAEHLSVLDETAFREPTQLFCDQPNQHPELGTGKGRHGRRSAYPIRREPDFLASSHDCLLLHIPEGPTEGIAAPNGCRRLPVPMRWPHVGPVRSGLRAGVSCHGPELGRLREKVLDEN